MKNILIIEDKAAPAEKLKLIIQEIDKNINVIIAYNSADAYKNAMETDIDLFLVDIILDTDNPNDASGLKFVDNIRQIKKYKFVPVIFVTSLYDPKMYAYSHLHCYSFLEKPYNEEKAKSLIEEALEYNNHSEQSGKVYFGADGIVCAYDIDDIKYVNVVSRKVYLYTSHGKDELSYMTCANILKQLNSRKFVQCSRNCIINTDYIENIDPVNRYIRLKDVKELIDIGSTFRKKFLAEVYDGL